MKKGTQNWTPGATNKEAPTAKEIKLPLSPGQEHCLSKNITLHLHNEREKKKEKPPPRKQKCSFVLITSSLSLLHSGRSLHCSCLDWDRTARKHTCVTSILSAYLCQTENTFTNYCCYLEVNTKNQEEHQVLKILQVTNWIKIPLQLQEFGSMLTIFSDGKSYSLPQQMFSRYS